MLDTILIALLIYYSLGLVFLYAEDERAALDFLEWPVRVWANIKAALKRMK